MTAAVVRKRRTKGKTLSGRSVPLITLTLFSVGFLIHGSYNKYFDRHGITNTSAAARGMEAEGEGGEDGNERQMRGVIILLLSCRCRCRRFAGRSKGVRGRQRREAESKGGSGRLKQKAEAKGRSKGQKQMAAQKGGKLGSSEAEAAECSMLDVAIRHPLPAVR